MRKSIFTKRVFAHPEFELRALERSTYSGVYYRLFVQEGRRQKNRGGRAFRRRLLQPGLTASVSFKPRAEYRSLKLFFKSPNVSWLSSIWNVVFPMYKSTSANLQPGI